MTSTHLMTAMNTQEHIFHKLKNYLMWPEKRMPKARLKRQANIISEPVRYTVLRASLHSVLTRKERRGAYRRNAVLRASVFDRTLSWKSMFHTHTAYPSRVTRFQYIIWFLLKRASKTVFPAWFLSQAWMRIEPKLQYSWMHSAN